MIIWLASYPRSGNTLLRNIFKKSMGLGTYSQHKMASQPTNEQVDNYGLLNFDDSWDAFYHKAANSKEVYLIKTHFLPYDNHPVIYVVRDGRLSLESYLKQYQERSQKWPGLDVFVPTYFDLLIGRDYYSDWSHHYNAWLRDGSARRLELRYEDIVEPSKDILGKIAEFVGYKGEISQFVNERTKDNPEKPISEKRGASLWQRPEHRTEIEELIFLCLHGDLLLALGYIEQKDLHNALGSVNAGTIGLLKAASSCSIERFQWMNEAIEKEAVIARMKDGAIEMKNGSYMKIIQIFNKLKSELGKL